MLTGPWSGLRSTSSTTSKKTVHSAAAAQPFDEAHQTHEHNSTDHSDGGSGSDRSRNHAVDGIASSSVQDSEFDEDGASSPGLITTGAAGVATKSGYKNSPSASSPKKVTSSAVQATSPSSGGLLASLTSSRLTWTFPVVRAIHGVAAPTHGEITPSGLTAALASNSASRAAAKTATRQMKQLEKRGQWVQQQIIDIDRCGADAITFVAHAS